MSVKTSRLFMRFRNAVAIPSRAVGQVWFAIHKGGLHVVLFF